jgi:hypothetical protein
MTIVALMALAYGAKGFGFNLLDWFQQNTAIKVDQAILEGQRSVDKQELLEQNIVFPVNGRTGSDWIFFNSIFGRDQTVLVYGVAVAGIDYGKHPQQVRIDGDGTLHVSLPAPEILRSYVEYGEDKTQVINVSGVGLFIDDKQLQNSINNTAQQKIDELANKSDLLNKARREAILREELYWRQLKDQNPEWNIKDVRASFQDGWIDHSFAATATPTPAP